MYKSKASDFNCKKPKNINLNIHFEAKKFFFLYGLYINKYYIILIFYIYKIEFIHKNNISFIFIYFYFINVIYVYAYMSF